MKIIILVAILGFFINHSGKVNVFEQHFEDPIYYIFDLKTGVSVDKMATDYLPGTAKKISANETVVTYEILLDDSKHEIDFSIDNDRKIFDLYLKVNFTSDNNKGQFFSKNLVAHLIDEIGKPKSFEDDKTSFKYLWETSLDEGNVEISVHYQNNSLVYNHMAVLDLGLELNQGNRGQEGQWNQFVNDVINNEPYLDWSEHGANDEETVSFYESYFQDDFVKQMLKENTFDKLEKGSYQGVESLFMYVVIASSKSINGSIVHFTITEEGVKILGLEPYAE